VYELTRDTRWYRAALIALGCALLAVTAVLLTSSPSSARARRLIPAAVRAEIRTAALTIARQSGDSAPTSIKAVETTHGRALLTATPGDVVSHGAGQTVYLVVMTGHFTYRGPVPPHARVPTGTYLAIVLSPRSLALEDLGLSFKRPATPLTSDGPVVNLRR